MIGFSSIALSSTVLEPTQDPVARRKGVHECIERSHHGPGTHNTWQGLITVPNTLEKVCLLALVLLEGRGSHPPDHSGALCGAGHYWEFSIFKLL